MKPGPKPHADRPVEWRVNLPSSLAAEIELMLYDARFGKIKYGARSDLIQALLREWLDKQKVNHGQS